MQGKTITNTVADASLGTATATVTYICAKP